ncbi:MAG: TetR/AcrR family transcriptional regulator [Syntrophaceae bacterium]
MPKKEQLEPRKIPSQERSRATVAYIYQAAAQVFSAIGYAAATTDRIAERAGVSIGTLYQYFPGKEAILLGLWEQHVHEIMTAAQRIVQDIRRQGFIDRGIAPVLLRLILEHNRYDRAQHRLFISRMGLPEAIIQKHRELGRYMESTMEEIFRAGANVRIQNPKIGAHLIWETVRSVIHEHILSGEDEGEAEAFIDELADMLNRYVFSDEKET